jgi:hypothetical protein
MLLMDVAFPTCQDQSVVVEKSKIYYRGGGGHCLAMG